MTQAKPSTDPRIADIVKKGEIRVALYVPQYSRDPATGELRGWTIDLVAALGERMGVKGVPVEHPTPPQAVESVASGNCDTSILGIEKVRGVAVDYSPGLLEADYTLVVPAGSQVHSVADADRPGVRIAVVRNHASTLTLERMLKHATLVYEDLPNQTFELMRDGKADMMASLHEIVLRYSKKIPGSRVVEGRYGFNTLALAAHKGLTERLSYLTEFVEEAKANGTVQRAIDRSGWHGLHVAPKA
jgi:polar amino acid transport system substrate-binding protein